MRKLFVYVFLHIRFDFGNICVVDNRKIHYSGAGHISLTVVVLKAGSKPEII